MSAIASTESGNANCKAVVRVIRREAPRALGVILVIAAALKAMAVERDTAAMQWQLGVSTIELILGFLLISGFAGRRMHAACIVLFAIFTAYTIRSLTLRQQTCGCFGTFAITPLTMLAFDSTVLALLLAGSTRPTRVTLKRIGQAAVAVAIAGGGAAIYTGANANAVTSNNTNDLVSSNQPVTVESRLTLGQRDEVTCDLGPQNVGGTTAIKIFVENAFDQRVIVRADEVECSCTRVVTKNLFIEPHSFSTILIEFDKPSTRGRYSKFIRFTTDAPAGRSVKIVISADLK